MGRVSCNLELGMLPSSGSLSASIDSSNFSWEANHEEISPKQQDQMTIFYNGQICVCDVTELQARSIIWCASKKMEEAKLNRSRMLALDPISTTPQTGLSMKRSLKQFLEKRRHRVLATSPYHR